MKLTDAEKASLAPRDDGSYSCACPGHCPTLPCNNERDDLTATVERIIAVRLAAEQRRVRGIFMSSECPHEGPYAAPCQGLIDAAERIMTYADGQQARGR